METINYAYLSGCLKGKLLSLVFDENFPIDSWMDREEYINNMIMDAINQEKEWREQVTPY